VKLLQLCSPLWTRQLLTGLAFVQSQRLQLIGDPCAHLYKPMPVPEQLPQISILRTRCPDPGKAIFQHQLQQELSIPAIGLLLPHTTERYVDSCSNPVRESLMQMK
jgi:hypothetical protein